MPTSILYGLHSGGGFQFSTDGGATWTRKTTTDGLLSNDIVKWVVDRKNGKIYLIHNNLVSSVWKEGLSISADNGTTWTTVANITDPIFSTLSVPANGTRGELKAIDAYDNALILNYGNAGLVRSTDNGASWMRVGDAAHVIVAAKIARDGKIYAIKEAEGTPRLYTLNAQATAYTSTNLAANLGDSIAGNMRNSGSMSKYENTIDIVDGAGNSGKNLVCFTGGYTYICKDDANLMRLRVVSTAVDSTYALSDQVVCKFIDGHLYIGGERSGGKGVIYRYEAGANYDFSAYNTQNGSGGTPTTKYYQDNSSPTPGEFVSSIHNLLFDGTNIYASTNRGILPSSSYGYYKKTVAAVAFTKVVNSTLGTSSSLWQYLPTMSCYLQTDSAPTDVTLSSSTIAENAAANAVVGTLSATDDQGGAMTYSLVSGTGSTDNASFMIDGSSLKLANGVSLNYEAKSSYSVRIQATDSSGLSYSKQFTITVTNVNEDPSDITLSASSIQEGNAVNAVIGTLSAIDPDTGDTSFTFSITGGADQARFNINGSSLRASQAFDYEAPADANADNVYVVQITAQDAGGLSYVKSFNITVTNNTADDPVAVSSSQVVSGTGGKVSVSSASNPTVVEFLLSGSALPVGSIVKWTSGSNQKFLKITGGATAFKAIPLTPPASWKWSADGSDAWDVLQSF